MMMIEFFTRVSEVYYTDKLIMLKSFKMLSIFEFDKMCVRGRALLGYLNQVVLAQPWVKY